MNSIIMIVDNAEDGQLLVECLWSAIRDKVRCICMAEPPVGMSEVQGVPLIGLETMPPLDQSFLLLYSHDFEDIKGNNVFNIYEYDLFWSKLSPEHYMIIEDFENIPDKNRIETLVIGMSYIQRGLNPDMTDSTVATLASPTQDIFYDCRNYRWAEENGVHSQRVIWEVAPYRLWYDLSLSNNRVRTFYYYPQAGSLHHFNPGFDVKVYYEGMKNMHDKLFDRDVIRAINDRKNDEEGYDVSRRLFGQKKDLSVFGNLSDEEREAFAPEVERLFHKPYEETYKENTCLIREMVTELCDRRIHVDFVLPPYPDVFRKYMDCGKYDRTLDFLKSLMSEFDTVNVYDFTDDMGFDDAMFSDWCHLNYYGACRLTELLFCL